MENAALAEAAHGAEGSLAKILAARKARRRGKGGRQSLSERLKNVTAEASDS